MTAEAKRPLIFMSIDLITFITYYIILLDFREEFISTGELQFWGAAILILVPLMILARILLYIIYSIMNTVIRKKKEEKFIQDEFGHLIKLKSGRNFNSSFMISFLVTMGFLVLGISLSLMFKFFYFSILLAFLVENVSEFYYVKKGI